MNGSESGFLSRLVGSRRNRILIGLGALLLVGRAALPFVLRPILVARADEALVGRIELGDLDLSLLRGGVTLHEFSVHIDERPSDAPALFEADRLWTQISWLALLRRTIEIEEFEVEGFAVRLDRFEDGLVLPKPIASASDAEPPADARANDAGAAPAWSFAANEVVLRDGSVALRDHTVSGEPQRFEFGIEDLSARELAIRTHPGDDEPGRIAIEAMLDEGSVSLAAWIKQQEDGLDIRATLDLAGIPIDKARAYLTMFDWNALSGRLDAALEYRSEPGGRHELGGRAAIADLRIGVPALAEPAFAWERLEVVAERIDLAQRAAEITSIRSEGARLVVDPRAASPIAVLAPGESSSVPVAAAEAVEDEDENEEATSDAHEEQGDTDDAAEPSPFAWRIGELILSDAVVELRGAAEPLPLRIEAELSALSSEAGARAPLALDVGSPSGSLTLDGELAPTPLAFDGKLAIHDLALAPLMARIDAPAVHWLRDGLLRANLDLAFAGDLRASGRIGLAQLDLEEATTAKQFGVAWQDLELVLSQLVFPDLLGPGDPAKPRAVDLRLARIRLVGPDVRLTRTAEGIVLPPLEPEAAETAKDSEAPPTEAEGAAPNESEEAPSEADPPAPDEAEAAPSTIALRVALDALKIEGGRARIADRAVEPFYRAKLEAIDLQASGIAWPERRVESLDMKVQGLRGASLSVHGSIDPEDAKLEGTLVALPLDQFNPYLVPTGYSLSDGALSLDSRARLRGERFTTRNKVVVQTLAVGGAEGEAAFQESFGIPLSVALGLLKDLDGKITLALPVAGERDKVDVGVGRLIGQALRKALVGALASPLKLLGAVTRDGKVERIAPAPIAYAPGTATLSAAGSERADEIATLLATTPSLSLELKPQIASADLRVLREQSLLAELETTSGLRALATLGERTTRRAVRDFLARKRAGEAGTPLSSEDARWLEEALAAESLAPEALVRLAGERAEHLRSLLESEHGIAGTRIVLGEPTIDPPASEPGVALVLGGIAAAP